MVKNILVTLIYCVTRVDGLGLGLDADESWRGKVVLRKQNIKRLGGYEEEGIQKSCPETLAVPTAKWQGTVQALYALGTSTSLHHVCLGS